MENNLVVNHKQEIVLNWDSDSFIPSGGDSLKLDIVLHEAKVSHDSRVDWTSEIHLASQINNTGAAKFEIPGPRMLPLLNEARGYSDTAHFILLFQLIVNTSSSNTDQYFTAMKQLNSQNLDAGIWSHVFFRKVKDKDDTTLCSEWMNTNDNHPTSYEGVDACPCTQAQADLPMSTFAPRTTPGQKKLDEFFHKDSVCYEPKRTIV